MIFGGCICAASQAILNVEDRNGGVGNGSPCQTMIQGDEETKGNSCHLTFTYLKRVSRVFAFGTDDMPRQHAMHRWPWKKSKNAFWTSGQSLSTSVVAGKGKKYAVSLVSSCASRPQTDACLRWWMAKGQKSSATPPRTHGSARMRMHPITDDPRRGGGKGCSLPARAERKGGSLHLSTNLSTHQLANSRK